MNWDDLRVISAIHQTGSYTRAANSLDVDETTVARRIARVETMLGFSLFTASHGRREPTEDCLRILNHLAAMERASESINAMLTRPHVVQRRLRLSTIGAIASFYLAPALPDLLDAQPNLTLNIDTSDSNIAMSRWEADFALRLGRPNRGDAIVRRIGTLHFSLVRPRDTNAQPLLALYPGPLLETPEMLALENLLGGIQPRLETSDLTLLHRFVSSGRGMGVLPDRLARSLMRDPKITIEPLDVTREVWLLSQPHLRDDSLARCVSEWCIQQFAATQPQP